MRHFHEGFWNDIGEHFDAVAKVRRCTGYEKNDPAQKDDAGRQAGDERLDQSLGEACLLAEHMAAAHDLPYENAGGRYDKRHNRIDKPVGEKRRNRIRFSAKAETCNNCRFEGAEAAGRMAGNAQHDGDHIDE